MLVRIAAEAVVGVLKPGVDIRILRQVKRPADIGRGAPAAFVAGHAVAGGPFEAAGERPVLHELDPAGGIDAEFVVVALDAGGIPRLDGTVESLATPPHGTP